MTGTVSSGRRWERRCRQPISPSSPATTRGRRIPRRSVAAVSVGRRPRTRLIGRDRPAARHRRRHRSRRRWRRRLGSGPRSRAGPDGRRGGASRSTTDRSPWSPGSTAEVRRIRIPESGSMTHVIALLICGGPRAAHLDLRDSLCHKRPAASCDRPVHPGGHPGSARPQAGDPDDGRDRLRRRRCDRLVPGTRPGVDTGVRPSIGCIHSGLGGWLAVLALVGMAVVGFLDDWIKYSRQRSLGLSKTAKFGGQIAIAALFAFLATNAGIITEISFVRPLGEVSDLGAVLRRLGPPDAHRCRQRGESRRRDGRSRRQARRPWWSGPTRSSPSGSIETPTHSVPMPSTRRSRPSSWR